ncbi:uncharacterized protein LOC103499072 [Cucumis melo]|uniref:Uncharacterized protein LOC103499072 n=1 Tax=Cucumis melo TaxID=3656 RepID=A0ABM3KBV9_CUCME|nr:uncharacterized protein LOC103499072 [Cucumis melo]
MFPLPPPKGAPAPETPKKEAIKSYKLDLSSSSDDRSIIPKYFALQNYSPRHPQPITAPFLQNIHGNGNRDDRNLSFHPVSLHDNVVALRCLGNTAFCTIITADNKENCLNASDWDLMKENQFEVSENYIISSRRIDSFQYMLGDGRIYGERVWSMAKGYAINKTEEPEQIKFTFSFEDKRNKKWTSIFAKQFQVIKRFNVEFPSIKDGEVVIGDRIAGPYTWGETDHNDKISMSCNSTITVPPMSKVKVNVVVKRGFCEVPFSYIQAEINLEGQRQLKPYIDGVFTGFNSYQFQITTDKEALPV